ncbi:TerB family tellurite resistance protein [Saprospiraceae bacterium]|jgi:uncharacterized tellurite resistance protein B-like protein|nr:TerB family tellurite resistance protein [Saprospiraceae bacterium]MDG1432605.1 hypothetical protein [Saprospiraceae bacterium]
MFEEYDLAQRKSIIALLFKLAKSDDSVSNIEKLYLRDIANSIGIDSLSIDEIIQNPEAYPLKVPLNERERMTILYYLLFMMRVDGRIEKGEEKLIYTASFRLGFNEKLTEDLIGVMKTYLNKEIPPDLMLTLVKKYLN